MAPLIRRIGEAITAARNNDSTVTHIELSGEPSIIYDLRRSKGKNILFITLLTITGVDDDKVKRLMQAMKQGGLPQLSSLTLPFGDKKMLN